MKYIQKQSGYISFICMTLFLLFTQNQYVSGINLIKPQQFLREKYLAKLDTNPYYYFQYQRQEEGGQACTSLDGPYCQQLNNRTIVYENNENMSPEIKQLKQSLKHQIMRTVNDIESHQKSHMPKVYYTDKSRQIIDKKLFYEPADEKVPFYMVINLEDLEDLLNQDQMIPFQIKFKCTFNSNNIQYLNFPKDSQNLHKQQYDLKTQTYGPMTHNQHLDQEKYIEIVLRNFYLPPLKMVEKRYKKDKEESESKKLKTVQDLIKSEPYKLYAITQQKEQGEIYFSKAVQFQSVYLRQQIFDGSQQKSYEVLGYLDGELQFTATGINKNKYNKWIKVENSHYSKKVDKLVFQDNMNMDNLLIYTSIQQEKIDLEKDLLLQEQLSQKQILLKNQMQQKTITKSVKLEDLQNLFPDQDLQSGELSLTDVDASKLMDLIDYGDLGDIQIQYTILDMDASQYSENLEQLTEKLLQELKKNNKDIDQTQQQSQKKLNGEEWNQIWQSAFDKTSTNQQKQTNGDINNNRQQQTKNDHLQKNLEAEKQKLQERQDISKNEKKNHSRLYNQKTSKNQDQWQQNPNQKKRKLFEEKNHQSSPTKSQQNNDNNIQPEKNLQDQQSKKQNKNDNFKQFKTQKTIDLEQEIEIIETEIDLLDNLLEGLSYDDLQQLEDSIKSSVDQLGLSEEYSELQKQLENMSYEELMQELASEIEQEKKSQSKKKTQKD